MPISNRILSAIQSAGAAVYAADAELKTAAQEYAEQVHSAMRQNPFDLGNDTLFEDWKTVARLSQALSQIEQDLKNIYNASVRVSNQELSGFAKPHALVAPTDPQAAVLLSEVTATDVKAKKTINKGRQVAVAAKSGRGLSPNAQTVLSHLSAVLNPKRPTKVNKAALAKTLGLAQGSIGAILKRLLTGGHLVEDSSGYFKLATTKA